MLGPVEVTSATGTILRSAQTERGDRHGGGVFNSESLVQGRARVYHADVSRLVAPEGPLRGRRVVRR